MHKLSYRIKWRFLLDLGYEFLVDGTPLVDMVETRKNSSVVPLGLAKERCPGFPEFAKREHRMIIAVCNCGEWGCGVDDCRIAIHDHTVVIDEFCSWKKDDRPSHQFEFARDNFDEVVRGLQSESQLRSDFIDRYVEAKNSNNTSAIQEVLLDELRVGLSKDDFQREQVFCLVERLLDKPVEELKNPMLP